jgi:hypothetical protein
MPLKSVQNSLTEKNPEDALPSFLEKYLQIIPGKHTGTGSGTPPCFILLSTCMPADGCLPHYLLADRQGILTLVFRHMVHTSAACREGIGLIIEYAAGAGELWGGGKVQARARQFWSTRGRNADDILAEKFGTEDFNAYAFWQSVEDNLAEGHIRFILAAGELNPEARRLIAYLNNELRSAEILALEGPWFETGAGDVPAPAPGLTEPSPASHDTQPQDSMAWTADRLHTAYGAYHNKGLGERLQKILDWASAKKIFQQAEARNPAFGILGKSGERIVSFFADGSLYCFFNEKLYPGGHEERTLLIQQLQAVHLLEYGFDPSLVPSCHSLLKKVQDLSDDELDELLTILLKYCL